MQTGIALTQNSAKPLFTMMQLEFNFEADVPEKFEAVLAEKTPETVAMSDNSVPGPVEEAPAGVSSIPDVIVSTHDKKAQQVKGTPHVAVELWDGLESPCRSCERFAKSKKNCSLKCPKLARFQEKLRSVSPIAYGTSDPNGSEAVFGYI